MFWLTLIHLDRRNIKYPLDLTMVHTEYTIEESFNIYTVTGNYVRYLLRYHSEYIKSFFVDAVLKIGTILDVFTSCLPVMYIGLVVIGQNYQKHLKRNQSTFFFSLNDKMLRFKKINKLMYQRVNARFTTFCRVTLLLKIDKLYPFNFIYYYLIDMF